MSYALPQAAAGDAATRAVTLPLNAVSTALGGSARVPLDLRALTAEAFGYSPLRRYQVPPTGSAETNAGRYPAFPAGEAVPGSTGLLGLPAFMQVNLHAARNPVTLEQAGGMSLLDPIVTVAQAMSVVKTAVEGRRGTIKEYIGADDYAVTIRAILATDPHAADRFAYPLPLVQKLRALVELGVALPVSGFLLDTYGIKSVVVTNVRYESLPGFTNLQAYEIECLSDEPAELTY